MSTGTPRFRVMLRSEQTNDQLSIIEITVPAGWARPRCTARGAAGTVTFAPRGSHHTVANLSNADAQYMLVCTPGSFERYFDPASTKPYPETIVVGPTIARHLADQRSAR